MTQLDDGFQDEEEEKAYSTYKKFVYLKKYPQMSMKSIFLKSKI